MKIYAYFLSPSWGVCINQIGIIGVKHSFEPCIGYVDAIHIYKNQTRS